MKWAIYIGPYLKIVRNYLKYEAGKMHTCKILFVILTELASNMKQVKYTGINLDWDLP